MTEYEQKLADMVSRTFAEAEREDNWEACCREIMTLVTSEARKSFRNGVKWAKHNMRQKGQNAHAEETRRA